MPTPVFIVCGTGSSVDENDKRLSVFGIVDKLTIHPMPKPQPGQILLVKAPVWHVFAVWLHNDDEPWEQEYDCEYRLILPNGTPIQLGGGAFKFSTEPNLPFYRLGAHIEQFPSLTSGLVKIENRIRRKGTEDEWSSQFYPIIVEQSASDEAQVPPLDSQK